VDFRFADSFTVSLSRLTGEEQEATKTTVFELQPNPANPGMRLHRNSKRKGVILTISRSLS
jgi:hypothetical protein